MNVTGKDFLSIDFISGCAAVVYVALVAALPALDVVSMHFASPAAAGTFALAAFARWIATIGKK